MSAWLSTAIAREISCSCSSVCRPARSRLCSTPDSADTSRAATCSADISSENIATAEPCPKAAFRATPSASADFPTDGRAASTTRSDACSPSFRSLSKSANPLRTGSDPSGASSSGCRTSLSRSRSGRNSRRWSAPRTE